MKFLRYNLQHFAEEGENNVDNTGGNTSGTSTNNSANDGDGSSVDMQALAEIISDKDKKLETLTKEVEELKKANAKMVVQMTTGARDTAKTFEENLLELVGAKPRKE